MIQLKLDLSATNSDKKLDYLIEMLEKCMRNNSERDALRYLVKESQSGNELHYEISKYW